MQLLHESWSFGAGRALETQWSTFFLLRTKEIISDLPKDTKLHLSLQHGHLNCAETSEQSAKPLGPQGWSLNLMGLLGAATVPTSLNIHPTSTELPLFRYVSYLPPCLIHL